MVCSHIWLDWLTLPRDDCHFFYIFLSFCFIFVANFWHLATKKRRGGGTLVAKMECGKCKGGFRGSNTLELLALHLAYFRINFCNIETK